MKRTCLFLSALLLVTLAAPSQADEARVRLAALQR
jgi:hypothetical protein